ncbi:MAG TPA: hypothetical protein VFP64_13080 [Pyrinomonadaceae bacterium]|nr:hypothetical protein [Pyrinomonadaceae bacterium]
MRSFFSRRTVRLLSAIGVSVWMAGGCLFTCSGSAMAAGLEQKAHESSHVAVAGHSCHAMSSRRGPSLTPTPRGTADCPLAVNAVAATTKNSNHLPDSGRGPISVLSLIENRVEQSNISSTILYVPNRGPTHLRCCVFLI